MKAKNFLGKLSLVALIAIATQSCKKENGIDNNNVIQRPYVVYAADLNGSILKTNDGNVYQTIFPGDGTPLRALIIAQQNMIIVKRNAVFHSKNEGKSFIPTITSNVNVATSIKWPFFLIYVPGAKFSIVEICNLNGFGGLSFSPSNGEYYDAETHWITPATSSESITFTSDRVLYTYSVGSSKLYNRFDTAGKFTEVPAANLPKPQNFYLSHFGATLTATDYDGLKGAWYSIDSGKTFKAYSGLPTGKILYTTYGAFEKLLVGVEGMGVYVAEGTTFKQSSGGMDANTSVYSIVAKDNYYKNELTKKFIYAATNTGIYRSEDLAKSWVKVKEGSFNLLY